MEIEIIFHSSSTPKKIKNAKQLYTKGEMVCVQLDDGWIVRYPLLGVFSVASRHENHVGTTQNG
jgi:hypothetical protein